MTTAFNVTSAGWTEVAAGPGDCIVQMKGNNPVLLHAAGSDPGAGVIHGIELVANNQGVAWPTLPADRKLYARASNAPASLVVAGP